MSIFRDYFNERVKTFNDYHSRLLIEPTEEDIHKLRTTIKKLRTLNALFDGLLFRQKDFPVGFNEIFKLTGDIRDIQIQQNILKDYNTRYKSYLSYSCKEKVSKFKIKESYESEFQYLEDKLALIENYHIDEQLLNNIEFHIKMLFIEVANMCKLASPENLHDIRKKVKRIYYIKLMVSDLDGIEVLDNIQETIGMWHDSEITIQNIKQFDLRELENIDLAKILEIKKTELYSKSLELLKYFDEYGKEV